MEIRDMIKAIHPHYILCELAMESDQDMNIPEDLRKDDRYPEEFYPCIINLNQVCSVYPYKPYQDKLLLIIMAGDERHVVRGTIEDFNLILEDLNRSKFYTQFKQ